MLLNGKAPLPGQIVQLPNLAKTFREVVAKGKDGFYKGRVAQAIVNLIQSKGGVMELEDLANHKSTVVEPIKYTYANEVTVYEVRRSHPNLSAIFNSASAPQMDKASLSKFDKKRFLNLACIRYYCSPCLGYPGEYPRARPITSSVGDGT
jgi:gamma-glutamyltranspeptidase/glutathione hydrolase